MNRLSGVVTPSIITPPSPSAQPNRSREPDEREDQEPTPFRVLIEARLRSLAGVNLAASEFSGEIVTAEGIAVPESSTYRSRGAPLPY